MKRSYKAKRLVERARITKEENKVVVRLSLEQFEALDGLGQDTLTQRVEDLFSSKNVRDVELKKWKPKRHIGGWEFIHPEIGRCDRGGEESLGGAWVTSPMNSFVKAEAKEANLATWHAGVAC